LGSALVAFGVEHGISLAYDVECHLANQENLDPWQIIDDLFCNPDKHDEKIKKHSTASLCAKWQALPEERKALLKLISRFELTTDQAKCFYVHEDERREKYGISFGDAEIIENPYLMYELDREAFEPVNLAVIDRGLFPDQAIRENYPMEEPSKIGDATDPRRVRAFIFRQLEEMAVEGHSLYTRHQVIQDIRGLDVQPACPVDGDLMNVVEESFEQVIHIVQMSEGKPAYQLDRYNHVGNVIRKAVKRRLKGKRHQAEIDWRGKLDDLFGEISEGDDLEEDARHEKKEALEELYSSRFSVLIGQAGTGKTTLLKVLLNEPLVAKGEVLLLAPTGKARVRMEIQTGIKGGKTIAQFLMPIDRFETSTHRYHLSTREREEGAQTIIIDEASMLTEEQLAATIDALAGVQRLILIGDPKQLPPIGAGRPFLDIVTELEPVNIEVDFPRIGPGYAELTVGRRQQAKEGEERDDLLLADWFSGRPLDPGADEIWTRNTEDTPSKFLRVVKWENSEELREKLLNVLIEELNLNGIDDANGFELSIGGTQYGDWVYFNNKWKNNPGAASKIEDWQILSPVRNAPHGVEAINRLVQETFRAKTKSSALINSWNRKIPRPMGREGVLYGDKVINVRNKRRYKVFPKEGALQYVANGEIGIAVGQFKRRNSKYKGLPKRLEIEFSSQLGFKYDYFKSDFGEETEPNLELAYALTVHKVQGSEFGLSILIIPRDCRLLSRELLYTGLTRQQNKVILFHQGERHDLKKYSNDKHSEAARRLTNLFNYPRPVKIGKRFLEAGLIHRTIRGHSVRSKSEVIIANMLHSMEIDYQYEAPLIGKDGIPRYPDFTFVDDEIGITYYLEHLGMLRDPKYKQRWKRKLFWYRAHGILPMEEGGGPEGTLITTKDDLRGGIQADIIEKIIKDALNL
jgi:ATP-dependent exoDNAse (exonuclease V) alpha subunit